MRSPLSRVLLVLTSVVLAPAALGAQVVGAPVGNNFFPFGGPGNDYPGTVYQQVYSSSLLTGGVLQSISFFRSDDDPNTRFRATSFDIYVSTTTRAVNALNTSDFDSNRGADNMFFGSYTLDGDSPPPATLTFAGAGFNYDPLAGNLLLDFRFFDSGAKPVLPVFYVAHGASAAGAFSRAHDFGMLFNDTGLQTEFTWRSTAEVPEPATTALLASGLFALGLAARRRRAGAGHVRRRDG